MCLNGGFSDIDSEPKHLLELPYDLRGNVMQSNLEGRLRNFRLEKKDAPFCIYETVVEALSYDYLLKRAKQRNQAFFTNLGIA